MGLREVMPKVAAMVDARREQYGKPFVDGCIRAGMAGAADQFYAAEAGREAGTPFSDPVMSALAAIGATNGVPVLLIRMPTPCADGVGDVAPSNAPSRSLNAVKSR